MARLLHVLGGGLWQVPTIRLARAMGYDVLVSDIYAERPGYQFATKCVVADIRDRDATLAIAQAAGVDGIICDTTDVGVTTAAYVAEAMNLRGIGCDVASGFTNKYLMRKRTSKAGVHNPRYTCIAVGEPVSESQLRDSIGWPLIVKPVDSQSSRGVSKVSEAGSLSAAVALARDNSFSKDVIVEEWIQGTEVTVEAACYRGSVVTLGISDKEHYPDHPQVASRLAYPADFPARVLEKITRVNEKVVHALGLATGVTHAEYLVTGNEDVYLVEIAARGGGSRVYSDIAPYLSGMDVPSAYIDWVMGSDGRWPAPAPGSRAAVLQFISAAAGTVRAVHGVAEALALPGVRELQIEVLPGQRFAGAQDDRSRPGFAVIFGERRSEVLETARKVHETVRIEIES
ncbi:MAG TPA: ATP-grasp domain-containing protein [Candidatus Aquilonibacter sp.]|nr:ATP-grasp domain-containing protein [Candidatus Aquilonibacter sp.]